MVVMIIKTMMLTRYEEKWDDHNDSNHDNYEDDVDDDDDGRHVVSSVTLTAYRCL